MLTIRHIETMRAALLYWQQEMASHDDSAWGSYLEADIRPLTASEIEELRGNLATRVRFALLDGPTGCLVGNELWGSPDEVPATTGELAVATVVLPSLPQ